MSTVCLENQKNESYVRLNVGLARLGVFRKHERLCCFRSIGYMNEQLCPSGVWCLCVCVFRVGARVRTLCPWAAPFLFSFFLSYFMYVLLRLLSPTAPCPSGWRVVLAWWGRGFNSQQPHFVYFPMFPWPMYLLVYLVSN